MSEVDRILGRLQALSEAHEGWRVEIRMEMAQLHKEIRVLQEFRWKSLAVSATLATLASVALDLWRSAH